MARTTSNVELTKTEQAALRTKVKESLWSYEEIEQKLRDRVIEFLVEARDAACLLDLAAAYQDPDRKKFFKPQHGQFLAINGAERQKLQGLFKIDKASPGYYRRLGEIAGQVPEVAQSTIGKDDRVPKWLHDLIALRNLLVTTRAHYYGYGSESKDSSFRLQPMLADLEDGESISDIMQLVIDADATPYMHIARCLRAAGDWGVLFKTHPEHTALGLKSASASSREATLGWLTQLDFDMSLITSELAEMAVGSSKRVRLLALETLRKLPEQAETLLTEQLKQGNASARANAAEALFEVLGTNAKPTLQQALQDESGKRVKQVIKSLLDSIAAGAVAGAASEMDELFELPPVQLPTGIRKLPFEFVKELRTRIKAAFDKFETQYQNQMDAWQAPDRPKWMVKPREPRRLKNNEFDKLIQYIEGHGDKRPSCDQWVRSAAFQLPVWDKWADLSRLDLLHAIHFLHAFDFLTRHRSLHIYQEQWLDAHRNAQAQPYGLREVDAAIATVPKFNAGDVAQAYLQLNNTYSTFLDWEADAVWPVFVEHSELFRNAVVGVTDKAGDYGIADRRRVAIRVASMMPRLPGDIKHAIWSVALGEAKSDRPAARKALHSESNRVEKGLLAIGDGKQQIRIAGAELLAEVGDASAIDPLKKALKSEKQEIVKGSFLVAIEQLGGDVEEFLGRRKQLIDAKKGLQKARPKGMEWIRLDALARVRWEDDKPVASEILQWWVVQSIKFKSPACGLMLRRAIAMCRPDDTAALARDLLSTWIAYDTKTPSKEELLAEAKKQAAQHWKPTNKWLIEYYKTEEKYVDALVSQMQNTFLQSAIGQKGLLAIVSAAGDAECVKLIERYIRRFHGHRLAQSKALLETLGDIVHPSAIQLLLSLGTRFRTRGIQKRAAQLVQELADRQGWTMDELADRTIPDAGFEREKDEDGNPIGKQAELVLDYGSRKFSVVLNDDLTPVITREDGKQIKSMPAAAKNDDPELVKASKKEFSTAKKVVKEVVKNQAERFYEAACVQRPWPMREWQRYLASHPIAGALCRRVVWAARKPGETTTDRLFRPLEDGSLTDVNDDEFTLQENDEVVVAHSSLLDEPTETAWKQHLLDYEVPELFQQFGRPTYRLPEAAQKDREISEFMGYLLTTFRLRSKATKLGWVRGDIEDGGCFSIYHKPFRSQAVDAVLEFTGSYVPEEDIPAAIRDFYFIPLKPNDSVDSWNPNKMALGKVPPVLLSECYNDVKDIAAEGSGFDPAWEKKGLF